MAERFRDYADKICELIREYFRELTGDKTVGAGIRVAIPTSSESTESGSVMYRTAGRAGLNPRREHSTVDIPANRGIPRYFIEKCDSLGVLLYNDLDEAARMGLFEKTQNEISYPDDISTMLVAPLNAWGGEQRTLIGLLYITSRKRGIFSHTYYDSVAFIADLVSASIGFTVERVQATWGMADSSEK